MSTVELIEIGPGSPDADVDAWIAVQSAAHAADDPEAAPPWRDSEVGGLSAAWPGSRSIAYLARVDGVPVAHARIGMPQQSNTVIGGVLGAVHPDHRRRGIGGQVLDLLLARLKAEGRTKAIADAPVSVAGGPSRDGAGAAFLAARGFRQVGEEFRRRLDLAAVDPAVEEALHAEALAKAGDEYEVVRFGEPAPEEYVPDLAVLNGRLSQDVVAFVEGREPTPYDTDKIRAFEAVAAARLHRRWHAAVRHRPSGHLAAWAFLATFGEAGTHAEHGITIVAPEHRGHRLGLLAKIELHRYVRETEPALRFVDTWNATENDHMVAINERLGFVKVERSIEFERDI